MLPESDLRSVVAPPILEGADGKLRVRDVLVYSLPALLLTGQSDDGDVAWAETVENLTGEVKNVTRWALSARSRVDQNMVPGGRGPWAFGLREHAELVRKLAGKARVETLADLSYLRRRGRRTTSTSQTRTADSSALTPSW